MCQTKRAKHFIMYFQGQYLVFKYGFSLVFSFFAISLKFS